MPQKRLTNAGIEHILTQGAEHGNNRKNREQQKATDRQMKETDKRIGELSKRFGESVEYMVAPNV
jgi:hypothetical protein